ncbi:hypothetical protein [Snodgrassella sp. CFCC 13594]|uniref:hypothetical protein n=1 Tax=Snodgrassella sp. CFCC 13594 TaxID=1775559 RepID=UPI00082BCD38|nr:hypothetical protein [Snodgrassella sp. CFCC 13594]
MDAEKKAVLDDLYLLDGTVTVPEDPTVTVLVMQRRFFHEALAKIHNEADAENKAFLAEFSAKADDVIAAVEKTEQLRKEMLLEVLQSNEETITSIEERVQGSVSQRVQVEARQTESLTLALHQKFMKWILVMLGSAIVIQVILFMLK